MRTGLSHLAGVDMSGRGCLPVTQHSLRPGVRVSHLTLLAWPWAAFESGTPAVEEPQARETFYQDSGRCAASALLPPEQQPLSWMPVLALSCSVSNGNWLEAWTLEPDCQCWNPSSATLDSVIFASSLTSMRLSFFMCEMGS